MRKWDLIGFLILLSQVMSRERQDQAGRPSHNFRGNQRDLH
jgi:hypothetical protein